MSNGSNAGDDDPDWLTKALQQASGEAVWKVFDDPVTAARRNRELERARDRVEADIAKAQQHQTRAIERAKRQLQIARHWRRRITTLRKEVRAINERAKLWSE